MRIFSYSCLLSFLALAVWAPLMAQTASMGLIVAPTQVIFTPKISVMTMSVTNRSDRRMIHKIYLSDEVMGPHGGVTGQNEGFAYSARRILRFTPDALDLAPGEGQVIRLLARRPASLPAGDYHSHIVFDEQPLPPPPIGQTSLSSTTPEEDGGGSAKFGISTLLTVGVPVIVQQGSISSSLTLKGLNPPLPRLENGNYPPFEILLRREGNATARGYLTLRTPQGADLITPRNVSVYREIADITLPNARTLLGTTYKGPAVLRLAASGKKNAPVIGELNVTFP
jgi:hypothetical protein